jgi:hypothetical protein
VERSGIFSAALLPLLTGPFLVGKGDSSCMTSRISMSFTMYVALLGIRLLLISEIFFQFFPKMPFYNTAEATKYLKAFLGDHYVIDDTPAFQALWRNYNFCQFVEDEGSSRSDPFGVGLN